VVSRIPGASAQIVAYDIGSRIAQAQAARAKDASLPDQPPESIAEPQATLPVS